jgi:hypothetical protein
MRVGLLVAGVGLLLIAFCAVPLLYHLVFVGPADNPVFAGMFYALGVWLGVGLAGVGLMLSLPGGR